MSAVLAEFFATAVTMRMDRDSQQRLDLAEDRMAAELTQWHVLPVPFVRLPPAGSFESQDRTWHMVIIGPSGTPFQDGYYTFQVEFPVLHPLQPPELRCLTPNGRIPVGAVSVACIEQWSSLTSVGTIIAQVMHEFISPGGCADEQIALARRATISQEVQRALHLEVASDQPSVPGAEEGHCESVGEETGCGLRWTPVEREMTVTYSSKKDQKCELADLLAAAFGTPQVTPGGSESGGSSPSRAESAQFESTDMDVQQFTKLWDCLQEESVAEVAAVPRFDQCITQVKEGWGATRTLLKHVIALIKCEQCQGGGMSIRIRSDCALTAQSVCEHVSKLC
eukprot:TRINITY_DN71153_c0_g1_i1.p1 TRINITY_DN71153_c0_g1~~TRINITY_DN71153_c0_g1_i1.p1  ORF type:complete len:368 (+),score=110.96 TRINITY_DN71153_c0_g1_i1:92-1105(+)